MKVGKDQEESLVYLFHSALFYLFLCAVSLLVPFTCSSVQSLYSYSLTFLFSVSFALNHMGTVLLAVPTVLDHATPTVQMQWS